MGSKRALHLKYGPPFPTTLSTRRAPHSIRPLAFANHRVKAKKDSKAMTRLDVAGNAVRKATTALVKSAKEAAERQDDSAQAEYNMQQKVSKASENQACALLTNIFCAFLYSILNIMALEKEFVWGYFLFRLGFPENASRSCVISSCFAWFCFLKVHRSQVDA